MFYFCFNLSLKTIFYIFFISIFQDKLITIGLRQTLKAYNGNKLKWILLDSTMVNPSAVGQVMGLLATKWVPFFLIPSNIDNF